MFHALPNEIIVDILSWLPVASIAAIYSVSHLTKDFIDTNESTIYRNIAVQRHLIDSRDSMLSSLPDTYSPRALHQVHDWKSFCQNQVGIHNAWQGKGPSRIKLYPNNGEDVHRIKVDEQAGIIICSFINGGISVISLENGSVLWGIPATHVPEVAHVEYESGYLIYNMFGRRKEVWRLAEGTFDVDSPEDNEPDERQLEAHHQARERYATTYPKGHFVPWCVLQIPKTTNAFRYLHPHLLTATRRRMYLYDIPSGKLEKDFTVQDAELGSQTLLSYVELSSRYIFLSGYPSLRILSRESGRVLLDIPSDRVNYSDKALKLEVDPSNAYAASVFSLHDTRQEQPVDPPAGISRIYDQFAAAHVSPCGRHLALMAATSRLLIIPDFERMFCDNPLDVLKDIVVEIELGSRMRLSQYLAFDGERVAIVTDTGVFIVHLPELSGCDVTRSRPFVCRAKTFDVASALREVSCLQITQTALWLTWQYPLGNPRRVPFESYMSEILQYNVISAEHPIASIPDLPLSLDHVDRSARSAVCMIDFCP